ncbi:helix-turn-helix transcriptional regulator [Clostridium frigidicarnis]|uniref:AraC-type DNA-binding protein n=1 Tax=Clostridium frigidicarnis TaxID=84698 RepID=A0A1I1AY51_9CLOT|nr:AraC family transcriptional regulator [Clostridium frigidicarnis]SFB41193.1 AraC-type DNA-binding protein [Clostridium frigidicarnis]
MIKQYEYEVNNKESYGCSICHAFNEAYNSDITNFQYSIPKDAGSGDITRIIGSRGIRVTEYNLNFREPIEIHGVSRTPHMDMLFCLGDDMNWELPQVGKEFQLLSGQSYIGTSCETRKNSIYPAKKDIKLIEIKMPLCKIQDIIESIQASCTLYCGASESMIYGKYKVTPSIQVILQQILKCPYQDTIKQLYIEGKLLELVAVYLNEVVYETERMPSKVNISSEDLHCIYRAKDILDENIYETPSITCISKCILLNEYKLKKGFKEIYGVPMHTYVINKRLENAKFLLEQKNLTVSQVAVKVGYLNMSHFAAAFRKKYGVNPKEYMNDVKK